MSYCTDQLLTPNFSGGSTLNGTPGGDRWARVFGGQTGWLSDPLRRVHAGCSETESTNEFENSNSWKDILKKSVGQTLFFHAWGGDKNINSYIKWAVKEVKRKYNINVKHVKVSDTSNVVARILSEKNSAKNLNGAVDLVWINGENFAMMKNNSLLSSENWIFEIPNSKYLDFENNPSLLNDFGIKTKGMEMPWGLSQLTFYYDSKFIKVPPKSSIDLKKYILNNKGRFTFPQPPDFVGTSFLKQY